MGEGRSILNAPDETVGHDLGLEDIGAEHPTDGMMAEERRKQILQIVRNQGRAKVNDLATSFNTSAVTIRNDLNELHERGLVLRSHGGAVLPSTILRESPVGERLRAHSEAKQRIGAMAASLIQDGETIILDSGTTTLEIARRIKEKQSLQITTNGVNIAAELPTPASSPSAAWHALRHFRRLIALSATLVFPKSCRRSCVRWDAT